MYDLFYLLTRSLFLPTFLNLIPMGRQPGRGESSSQATGAVTANPCGTADGRQGNQGATRTRSELSRPRTAVRARLSLARGGLATGSLMAGAMASAVSTSPSVACGQAAQAAEKARTTAGETTQLQGDPSCGGQGQREKGVLKNLPV